MIRENELQEAIAECEGIRNPNASTCLKLAAFYTIRDHLYNEPPTLQRSFAPAPDAPGEPQPEPVQWEGDSEFARVARGLPVSYIMPIMDELMATIEVLQPRLYQGVMRRIRNEN